MGCVCSKASPPNEQEKESQREKDSDLTKNSIQCNVNGDGSTRNPSRVQSSVTNSGSLCESSRVTSRVLSKTSSQVHHSGSVDDKKGESNRTIIIERTSSKGSSSRRPDTVVYGNQRTLSISRNGGGGGGREGGVGWPSWLSSVAGEAIQGWIPRRSDSFEKLEKIGQGTYSSVYKARDLETGKIVAMKKVRFVNMDPESVRFMAREILVLRRLDHPNIMKLECLVTSRMSGSLYLVFEYMEHDLAGLSATPGNKFTEAQIKCYMKQLLAGLEHCHTRGILHRDIKGSNLLINNDGVLKIADFGLATFFNPDQGPPLTSRVVTLWYRAPELLLGSTNYGVAVDMWSVGCILAELFSGKPIMPGRTEVEQMHKIFKLCGSPSESYWKRTKFPHATSFKPQQPYKRCLNETFKDFPPSALALVDVLLSVEPEKRGTTSTALKSQFFTTHPLPCDPSSLPRYIPSKEYDVKRRDEEARRQKTEAVKGRGPESVRRGQRQSKITPESDTDGSLKRKKGANNYTTDGNEVSSYTVENRRNSANETSHSSSVVHPSAVGSSWSKKTRDNDSELSSGRMRSDFRGQKPGLVNGASNLSNLSTRRDDWPVSKDNNGLSKKNRMNYSGPLVPPGGNLEDMLKEHERQIQQAVRKSRIEKAKNKNENDRTEIQLIQTIVRNGW